MAVGNIFGIRTHLGIWLLKVAKIYHVTLRDVSKGVTMFKQVFFCVFIYILTHLDWYIDNEICVVLIWHCKLIVVPCFRYLRFMVHEKCCNCFIYPRTIYCPISGDDVACHMISIDRQRALIMHINAQIT